MCTEMVVLASYRHSRRSFFHAFLSGVQEIVLPPGRTLEVCHSNPWLVECGTSVQHMGIPLSAYRRSLEANRHRVHPTRYHEGFCGCKTTESDGL